MKSPGFIIGSYIIRLHHVTSLMTSYLQRYKAVPIVKDIVFIVFYGSFHVVPSSAHLTYVYGISNLKKTTNYRRKKVLFHIK